MIVTEETSSSSSNRRRRLAAFQDISSLRAGPKVRPYTEEMLGDLIAMFQRLMEKYSADQELCRILQAYIEKVQSTPPKRRGTRQIRW